MKTPTINFTENNRSPISDFEPRGITFSWPVRTSNALSEMKWTARAMGFKHEATRANIAAALVAQVQPVPEVFSSDLRAWRRSMWFVEPAIEYKPVGLNWAEPLLAKLAMLGETVYNDGAGKTSQTELSAFIVDTTALTTNALRGLLDWYRQATVADVYTGRADG